jgi:1-aminocyclopropane-1-carboxylate deaminase
MRPDAFSARQPVTLQLITTPVFDTCGVEVYLLRLDQIHPMVSGNKWFKLRYNLLEAKARGCARVLSFGGAFSNHLHALAWAGRSIGIETVGVVRGEPSYAQNPTLKDAADWGMKLHFVSREVYRRRNDPFYHKELLAHFPEAFIVPEGGSNALAVKGFSDLFTLPCWQRMPAPDWVITACGSGGTLAGIVAAKPSGVRALGVAVLKGADFLNRDVSGLLQQAGVQDPGGWQIDLQGHEGGYARRSDALIAFMRDFADQTGVELDPVYTGKMMFRLHKLVEQGTFAPGDKIVAVHTGGLQGCRGFL